MQSAPSSIKNQAMDKGLNGIEFEVGYGYRRDSFDWNIAGDLQGNNPNILSELKWEDLLIHEIHMGVRVDLKKDFVLKGSINYGVIVAGDNQDSDYAADNREMEFSRSNNDADKGIPWTVSWGLVTDSGLFRNPSVSYPLPGILITASTFP